MPAPTQTPHRTPLRRVSQGSLFRLSRSNAFPDAPHGLGFLEPAMAELLDETETLQTNIEGMKRLSDSLATFNESFASWLYIMNMNALTIDWPQVRRYANRHCHFDLCTTLGAARRIFHVGETACRYVLVLEMIYGLTSLLYSRTRCYFCRGSSQSSKSSESP